MKIKEVFFQLLGRPRNSSTFENAFYEKLIGIEEFNKSFSKYETIYFIGGFKNTDANYQRFESALNSKTVDEFLLETKYDVGADNVELYYIEENLQTSYLLILFDPVELLAKERIIRIIKNPVVNLDRAKFKLVFRSKI